MPDNLPGRDEIDFREALQRSLIDAADPLSEATNLGLVSRYHPRRDELPLDPTLVDEIDRTRWPRLDWADRTLILVLIATLLGGYAWAFGLGPF